MSRAPKDQVRCSNSRRDLGANRSSLTRHTSGWAPDRKHTYQYHLASRSSNRSPAACASMRSPFVVPMRSRGTMTRATVCEAASNTNKATQQRTERKLNQIFKWRHNGSLFIWYLWQQGIASELCYSVVPLFQSWQFLNLGTICPKSPQSCLPSRIMNQRVWRGLQEEKCQIYFKIHSTVSI